MLDTLRNHPYVFAIVLALLMATFVWVHARVTEKDTQAANQAFLRAALSGCVAALVLTWLVYRTSEPTCVEPFDAD